MPPDASSLYDIEVTTIDGVRQAMAVYRGRALLVVNVASRCGFTPQYAGLEKLYGTFKDRGFAVLGFPCDQFGREEPGTDAEIRLFCSETYNVTFPMFSKVEVNGPRAHPLFEFLKSARPGRLGIRRIGWNFTKFLVSPSGEVVQRYGTRIRPEAIAPDVIHVFDDRRT
jgi:glutathione peroxidase